MATIDRDVQAALERMDAAWRGNLADQIEDWEEIMRPILEETWGLGYSSALYDRDKRDGLG